MMILCVLLTVIQLLHAQRRLTNSTPLPKPKPYMVYLTKAINSPEPYDEWICGGVIVTRSFIITAAACVQDVRYINAIAGYDKYVENKRINVDPCTKIAKKKVVFTAVPKKYKFMINHTENWASADIAVAKVESPYNFQKKAGAACSYAPQSIAVNFNDPQLEAPGTQAFMLGWGHAGIWRQQGDTHNYNSKILQYGNTVIKSKQMCKSVFAEEEKLRQIIDNDNMLCTFGDGDFDLEGEKVNTNSKQKEEDSKHKNDSGKFNMTIRSRRSGICQNDHGGPLVVRSGSQDVLIGVASLFVVENSKCVEPSFYTSTYSNGKFLYCIITSLYNDTSLRPSGSMKSLSNFNCQPTLEEASYNEIINEKKLRRKSPLAPPLQSTKLGSYYQDNVERSKNTNIVRRRPQIPMNMLRHIQSPSNQPSAYLEILHRQPYYAPEDD